MKMAEYMEKHIGEEFEGIVSSVTSFGMFVELPNLIEETYYRRNAFGPPSGRGGMRRIFSEVENNG